MTEPGPIHVKHLYAPTLDALLALLDELSTADWERPAGGAWTVKDVAAHLLGGDVGILSRRRDGYSADRPAPGWEGLVAFIDRQNEDWFAATRRISPSLLRELLRFTGERVTAYFAGLDEDAIGEPVSWAGSEPAPVWFDLAREYTERWHHQQQIRDAVGRPGLMEATFVAPVLEAFVRALPRAFSAVAAADGSTVSLAITGEGGGRWSVRRESGQWRLHDGVSEGALAAVTIDRETAWRLFTKGLPAADAERAAVIAGDPALARAVFGTVSVIG